MKGSVVCSDAFFPFADGLIAAADAGATAAIQPGGSVDDDVIEAAMKGAWLWSLPIQGTSNIREIANLSKGNLILKTEISKLKYKE